MIKNLDEINYKLYEQLDYYDKKNKDINAYVYFNKEIANGWIYSANAKKGWVEVKKNDDVTKRYGDVVILKADEDGILVYSPNSGVNEAIKLLKYSSISYEQISRIMEVLSIKMKQNVERVNIKDLKNNLDNLGVLEDNGNNKKIKELVFALNEEHRKLYEEVDKKTNEKN